GLRSNSTGRTVQRRTATRLAASISGGSASVPVASPCSTTVWGLAWGRGRHPWSGNSAVTLPASQDRMAALIGPLGETGAWGYDAALLPLMPPASSYRLIATGSQQELEDCAARFGGAVEGFLGCV